jgi:transcriptional regulator with XRE-family HTH domain
MSHKLTNYLRTHRKRAGLSQDEIAFLLGCQSGSKISRYERFARQPNLQTAFAYEVISGTPARELFAGVFQEVESTTIKRVHLLIRQLEAAKPDRMTTQKLEVLKAIASVSATAPRDPS